MSPEARQASLDWLQDLWRAWLADVAQARNLSPEALEESIENFDVYVEKAGGEAAQALLHLGLVDVIGGREDVRQRMVELVGASSEDDETFSQVNFWNYLLALGNDRPRADRGGDAVGVILASGPILDGEQMPGTVGGDSTAKLIRQARRDDSIKAVVLRVDSGGGSQFASEVIRRELALLNATDKPVIVSMSSVAASGGYWISTEADEVWASPVTLTGSIGIYAMIPTFQRSLEEIGVKVDGVGTNWMAGALRIDRQLHPRLGNIIRSTTERNYEQFLSLVADARQMTVDEVDGIARGRVWSGADAKELGLVDRLGGLHEALAAAAERTQLGEAYSVRYLEPPLDFADQVLLEFVTRSARFLQPVTRHLARPSVLENAVGRFLSEQADLLSRFNDPRGIYAHCLCEIDG